MPSFDLTDADPLLALAVILLVGMFFGALAKRVHLPRVTGQILGGVALGEAGLRLFGESTLHALQPLTHFALGLMAVTIGAHLNFRRLRNAGKRLLLVCVAEATIVPLAVFGVLIGFTSTGPGLAALFATAAVATAPATIVAIIAEARAKGVFVKTLVAAVALNNMTCIFLFEAVRAIERSHVSGAGDVLGLLHRPALALLLDVAIGGLVALAMEWVGRVLVQPERLASAAVVALVLTSGIASWLGASPLLSCLFLGLVQTNLSRERDKLVDAVFSDFQPAILIVFFTLAGMHVDLAHAAAAGLIAALFFVARIGGKLVAASVAMRLAGATDNVRRNLGLALMPQAGVAASLVILLQDDPAFTGVAELFSAVVLAVITINEIVGPVCTRAALLRSGEAGMDRLRLLDFIQEENIVVGFQADSKEEAIRSLVDLMAASHELSQEERALLLRTSLEREEQASTCLGGGLAVPHGILPDGHGMIGVMGISSAGLDLDAPDGRPVHCMVLLGTSHEERDRHLQVLTALARAIGSDPAFQAQLFHAESAAHATELLQGEESHDFNYFLEDDDAA